ncbi:hypothetical protein HS961_17015 [Comamonas piscis]|uniref:Uncharacterized protein n=1 Tax=Comamonas piscis TaxID=1562974 RepID=A0A7G5EK71_9BURK|nr:hypothetical protein [Comamonas piscis]QMV74396.1 hypothetical protein HS961_17015 [Comamonas piscis]WSO32850.1 hypothetical protein VUJ63_17070 [Comamonas piscis]
MVKISSQQQDELQRAISEFVGAFEVVFRYDWNYSSEMIGDAGASFLEPNVENENEDWGARGVLLERYRVLVAAMKECGMEPRFPFPLENLPEAPKRLW